MISSRTYLAVPPGMTIKDMLDDRGLSQRKFASMMEMSEKHMSKLINGEVILTPDVAFRLEMTLGMDAGFWTRLEALYREEIIKVEAENAMDADIEILKLIPYREMVSKGWVPEARKAADKVINLRKFFNVVKLSLLEKDIITQIACKPLSVSEKSDLLLLAWTQAARIKARDIDAKPINVAGLIKAVPKLREMTSLPAAEAFEKTAELLASKGVVLLRMPSLKGLYVKGATFLDGRKIVILLSDKIKDADDFWFTLFREIAHVTEGHVKHSSAFTENDERDAEAWAGNILVPADKLADFKAKGDVSEKAVRDFAESVNLAPGVVVGRMQKDGLIRYDQLNNLKERVPA